MSGRRPVVKGLVEALRTLRVRSCLRPVGAETNVPLALMLVRMLFAQSPKRARYGACLSPGFRAVPLVHITSPSPSMRIALRRNLVPAELVGSGRDRT